MGEAPAALNAYLNAADCADTTSLECDYHTLSRVYGQMADVFYWQNLMTDYLIACDKSEHFAWKDCDTLQVLNEVAHKIAAYNRLKHYNKVISTFDILFNLLHNSFGIEAAAKYCILPIKALVIKGDLKKAKTYIDILKNLSGYFDSEGIIEKGREVCYYYIGMYYLQKNQTDSAEYYFRKELENGLDLDNQQMASYGLSHVYHQTHRLDSAIKYSFYSYDMLDSIITRMSTIEVERMAALHNYARHQEIANQEHLRANYEKLQKDRLYIVMFLLLILVGIAWVLLAKKRRKSAEIYSRKVWELAQTSHMLQELKKQKSIFEALAKEEITQRSFELSAVQQQNEVLTQQIDEANTILTQLRKELMKRHEDSILSNQEVDARLEDSPVYQMLQSKVKSCESLSSSEWQSIEKLVKTALPGFYNLITSRQSSLRIEGRRLCYLLRLHVGLKETAALMDISQSRISKLSRNVLLRVFQENGSGKELVKRLQDIL
jgi:hypothetical protein